MEGQLNRGQDQSSPPNEIEAMTLSPYAPTLVRANRVSFLKRQLTVNVADTRAREESRWARKCCQLGLVSNSESRVTVESKLRRARENHLDTSVFAQSFCGVK